MTPHELHVLPDSTHTAAQNMAHDFLLLNRYPDVNALRIRHYGWIRPAFTFGMSQTYNYALSEVPDPSAEICRRPTGGGVVNHLEDWTYSLVIPASHPLARSQPSESYRSIHECIACSMQEQGMDVILNFASPEHAAPSVCFEKPEVYDIVLRNLPTKVAGALKNAQKRAICYKAPSGDLLCQISTGPIFTTTLSSRFPDSLVQKPALDPGLIGTCRRKNSSSSVSSRKNGTRDVDLAASSVPFQSQLNNAWPVSSLPRKCEISVNQWQEPIQQMNGFRRTNARSPPSGNFVSISHPQNGDIIGHGS